MKIRRLLIANRGEIARRIIRACRELGVETVAVYSDADAKAPHVSEADQAVHIGAAPARYSYLNIEAIIEAAHAAHADAIHPGYGFLSERVRRAQNAKPGARRLPAPARRRASSSSGRRRRRSNRWDRRPAPGR